MFLVSAILTPSNLPLPCLLDESLGGELLFAIYHCAIPSPNGLQSERLMEQL